MPRLFTHPAGHVLPGSHLIFLNFNNKLATRHAKVNTNFGAAGVGKFKL